ncbi:MAG: LysM peptidoglycan-binding domain-containing protein [Chthoniobacterales bacterium]|nr:LysM peptidoglycan-binding domain-containing protein [Chthoniobacterales bacterium]
MKWLFALLLATVVFGGAALVGYKVFLRPEIAVRDELKGGGPTRESPDLGLPEFEAAAKLKTDGKLAEARAALTAFIQKYPSGAHVGEAQDLLGDVNTSILLSNYPSPEKEEYTVRSGDVLARIAARMKSTPELIMRTNNLSGTMLRIGDRLLISHPVFTALIQRDKGLIYLLDHDLFFKRYHFLHQKLPVRPPPKIVTRVAEILAWKNGKRIGMGSRDFLNSTRWIRLAAPGYVLYSEPDDSHPVLDVPPPNEGIGLSATDVEELSSLVNTKTAVTITP